MLRIDKKKIDTNRYETILPKKTPLCLQEWRSIDFLNRYESIRLRIVKKKIDTNRYETILPQKTPVFLQEWRSIDFLNRYESIRSPPGAFSLRGGHRAAVRRARVEYAARKHCQGLNCGPFPIFSYLFHTCFQPFHTVSYIFIPFPIFSYLFHTFSHILLHFHVFS